MLTSEQVTELEAIRNELYSLLMECAAQHDRKLWLACRTFEVLDDAQLEQKIIPMVINVPIETIISRGEQRAKEAKP